MAMDIYSKSGGPNKESGHKNRSNFSVLIIILCLVILVLTILLISMVFKKTCYNKEIMHHVHDKVHSASERFFRDLGSINNKTYYISRELKVI